jgi:hypothetical protein
MTDVTLSTSSGPSMRRFRALVGLRGTGQRARPKSDQRSNSGVEQAVAEAVVSGADADPGVLAAHEVGGDDAVLVLAEQALQLAPL